MSRSRFQTLLSLAAHEWRNSRFSPVWIVGLLCMAALAWSESDSSAVLGYPSPNQALYGFQLAASVLAGFIAFLLAAGSLAADLQSPQRDLIFTRSSPRWLYVSGKFLGLAALSFAVVLLLAAACAAMPIFHGHWPVYPLKPFFMVSLLCGLPNICFSAALAFLLIALFRRVVIAFPLFLIYFFTAALLRGPTSGTAGFFDFTGRLYPTELGIEVPLRLREYTFAGLLDPISPALWLHAGLYLLIAGLLLTSSLAVLSANLPQLWFSLSRRWLRRHDGKTIRATTRVVNVPGVRAGARPANWLADELSLLRYSAKMLIGRNLVSMALVGFGLILMVLTYTVSPYQTRESVLFYQLEMFGPLLGIIMFSDLVAVDFEARRSDLLRTSARGARWITRRRLIHAALFTVIACAAVVLILRVIYTSFSLVQALAVLLPGALFLGALAMLAASVTRKSLVGYALGGAALLLYAMAEPLQPLASIGYHLRENLASAGFLGQWNWVLLKVILLGLALWFALMVLRWVAQPQAWRLLAAGSLGILLVAHAALRATWLLSKQPIPTNHSSLVLSSVEKDGLRHERRADTTYVKDGPHSLQTTTLMDATYSRKDNQWQVQNETAVDLTREFEIPRLNLEVELTPISHLQVTAQFEMRGLQEHSEFLLFYLAHELEISRLLIDGEAATFTRAGSLVKAAFKEPLEPGRRCQVELHYGGNLQLPQQMKFEGASKDLLFVISRWFPSLRGNFLQPHNLFHSRMTVRVPVPYRLAGGRLTAETASTRTYFHETKNPVESLPLIVGRFREYRLEEAPVPLSFCTFTCNAQYAQRALQETKNILADYTSKLGPVPYSSVAIVENPFQNAGGQIQPGIIAMNPDRLVPEHQQRFLEGYLPHEAAHLWFGNSMPQWVAEGAAVFLNCRWLEQKQNTSFAGAFMDREFYQAFAADRSAPAPLTQERGVPLYTRSGYLLRMLQHQLGIEPVIQCLDGFQRACLHERRADRDARSIAFLVALKEMAGPSLEPFVEDWTRSVKTFDPELVSFRQENAGGGHKVSLALRHNAEIRFPVTVQFTFADGSLTRRTWSGEQPQGWLQFESAVPVLKAEIDPDHWLLDYNRANNVLGIGQDRALATASQDRFLGWKTFGMSDGLPGPDIRALMLDARGNLWAAAWAYDALVNKTWGVSLQNGNRWEPYAPRAEHFPLVSTMVATENELWFGSQGRLRKMAGDNATSYLLGEIRARGPIGRASFFPNPNRKSPFPGSTVYKLFVDSRQRLWIGTDHGIGLRLPGSEALQRFGQKEGLPGDEVFAFAEDSAGAIWAATDRGLTSWAGFRWVSLETGPRDLTFTLAFSPQGVLWAGTFRSGLVAFDPARNRPLVFSRKNAPLPDTIFSTVACDSRGGVWAGSPSGLVHFDGQNWRLYDRTNSGLPSNHIRCLLVDGKDHIWIATDSGLTRFKQSASSPQESYAALRP